MRKTRKIKDESECKIYKQCFEDYDIGSKKKKKRKRKQKEKERETENDRDRCFEENCAYV